MTALNNRLALTPQIKVTMRTIPYPKLLCHTHNIHIMTISHKQTGLRRPNKHSAVFAIIDENSC